MSGTVDLDQPGNDQQRVETYLADIERLLPFTLEPKQRETIRDFIASRIQQPPRPGGPLKMKSILWLEMSEEQRQQMEQSLSGTSSESSLGSIVAYTVGLNSDESTFVVEPAHRRRIPYQML